MSYCISCGGGAKRPQTSFLHTFLPWKVDDWLKHFMTHRSETYPIGQIVSITIYKSFRNYQILRLPTHGNTIICNRFPHNATRTYPSFPCSIANFIYILSKIIVWLYSLCAMQCLVHRRIKSFHLFYRVSF